MPSKPPAVYNFAGIAGCVVSSKNRISGSTINLYNSKQAQKDESQGSWVAVCETHGTDKYFTNSLAAKMCLSDPTEWCDSCRQAIRSRPRSWDGERRAV